jgi:hypothetical protein
MTTMYKNELFILMYCVPMIPTGELFKIFISMIYHDAPKKLWKKYFPRWIRTIIFDFMFHIFSSRGSVRCIATITSRFTSNEWKCCPWWEESHSQAETQARTYGGKQLNAVAEEWKGWDERENQETRLGFAPWAISSQAPEGESIGTPARAYARGGSRALG